MAEPQRPLRVQVVAWLFVAAQFALIGLMLFAPRDAGFDPGGVGRTLGVALMITGAALGVWAVVYLGRGLTPSPLPNGASQLVVAGPYRWVRHPMYVAVLVFMGGVALRSGAWLVVTFFVALVALFNVKARWEEAHLRDVFPGYERYAETTPRFTLNPTSAPKPAKTLPVHQPTRNQEKQ